jgi:hypothetical protein
LGVAVGAVATYLFDKRRERLDARTGLVLVNNDLRDAQDAVSVVLRDNRWPTGANKAWLSTWRQARPLIARRLQSEKHFGRLVYAYARMDELESGLNASRGVDDQGNDEHEFEDGSSDEIFLKEIEKRLEARDEVFGDTPNYDELLTGRRFALK